eukprot:CAMPEP_0173401164 /NCGR_PEP_ID=MMETSP1356-20130122/50070_1 /TAXON_ID=77927 ORGANISM="Hemiselmis virescens, Strain PCC157" /NCGR_SAMPLE_ID=MMETSP1356 /ASSEMBLY_ACC=CAM_ASM_000847 /LENGTH=283 /DNA_ID=CAMNT_0014361243 /DNA_START=67 /DNA_END=915 /DNA_ORIENTATION=-
MSSEATAAAPTSVGAVGGRVELHGISGIRFFATLLLCAGHATESLWIASGDEAQWFRRDTCSWLKRASKDMVSFYFVLAGFTMTWGYMKRDFETWESRLTYWRRRIARFYPDYLISTVVGVTLHSQWVFGCHSMSLAMFLFNVLALTLLPAWFFGLGEGFVNGPSWFMGTLFWLWILFPFILKPVKSLFSNDTSVSFIGKLFVLYLLALVPFCITFAASAPGAMDTPLLSMFPSWGALHWTIKAHPLARLPEFVMGMGLAVRILTPSEYAEIGGNGKGAWWSG